MARSARRGPRQPRREDVPRAPRPGERRREVGRGRGRGNGGAPVLSFTPSPDRFIVEELPAYPPTGEGGHTFLWIEKRGLTTFDAIARIAAALGVAARDIGYAGLKDKHATTRQWLSVPGLDPDRALALAQPDIRVLAAARHPHKLRLGHLRGNLFEVVLTGVASDGDVAALRARFEDLCARGVPNRFGDQRFGVGA